MERRGNAGQPGGVEMLRRVWPWVGLAVVALAALVGFLGVHPGMWGQDALLVLFLASVFALRRDVLSVVVLVALALVVDWYQLLPMPHTVYETALLGGIALVILICVAERKRRPWRTLRKRDLALWGIFLLLGLLAIPRGYNIPIAPKLLLITSVQYILNTFLIAFVFWLLGVLIVREPTHLRQLFSLLAAFGALIGLHAILQEEGIFLLLTPQQAAFLAQPIVNHFYLAGTHTPRATSFFLEPDIAESFLSSVALLPLGLLVASRTWITRALYGAELLLTMLGLLFTYGPVGWGVFIICLVLFLPFGLRGRARAYALGALAVVAVAGLALLPKVLHVIVKKAMSPRELGLRVQIWTSALHAIAANPLLGFGLGEGNVWVLRMRPYLVPGLSPNHPHAQNSFLEIAAVAGIPTLVALVLLLASGLYYAAQKYRLADWTMRPIIVSGALTVVALCLNGASDTTWTANMIVPFGWLIVGALASPTLTRALRSGRGTDVPVEVIRDREANLYPVRYGPPIGSLPPLRDTVNAEMWARREAGAEMQESGPIAAIAAEAMTTATAPASAPAKPESYGAAVFRVVKSSGIYAIASMGGPLVSLVMTPYIAHHLSRSDYGLLALLNTSITLTAGITALGLGSAFFRVYNFEYDDPEDRRATLATVTALLVALTVPVCVLFILFSTQLASVLLGNAADGHYIALAAAVVIVQNLTIPGLSWMRAECRAPSYVVLALTNLLVTLGATVVFVGPLNMGIAGALIGNGAGFVAMEVLALPFVIRHGGLRLRKDAAWRMVSFGAPQVLSLISYWFLQVSDRYLLAGFTTLAEVARYTAAYTLGAVIGTILIGPFQLAWPTLMYSVAKRERAGQVYAMVFRYYSLVLLLGAFGMGIVGQVALRVLFPSSYANAAPVIPPVALALALYGFYGYFMVGANVRRVLWMAPVFVTCAALANIGINLVAIPLYGSMGAAISTLLAYIVLAGVAYIANQRIYPIPYQWRPILVTVFAGVALYIASIVLPQVLGARWQAPVAVGALAIYGVVVAVAALGKDTRRIQKIIARRRAPALAGEGSAHV